MKKRKVKKGKSPTVKILVPSIPSVEVVPDFTVRAIASSNSKRIRFRKAIEGLIPKVKKSPLVRSIDVLVGEDGVASSLLPKVSKSLDLASKGLVLRGTKDVRIEGNKSPLVSEVSLSKV